MDFGFYEIDAWGEQLTGASAPQRCTLSGVVKRNSKDAPYAVTNEFICGRLGLLIGLPVPPGAVVTTDDDGKLAYVSLRFGPKGGALPPLDPQKFVEDNPSIAAGVIAFDCWIANPDRHQHNLAYVRGEPKIPVTVFDHSHALFGIQAGAAVQRLREMVCRPLVSGILRGHITSSTEFGYWADRIRAVCNELIRDICRTAIHAEGITEEECTVAAEFLIHRKEHILEMIRASKERMPNIKQW
jgi:HipA-like kinase